MEITVTNQYILEHKAPQLSELKLEDNNNNFDNNYDNNNENI